MTEDDVQQWRIGRLSAAANKAGGNAELGRMLGHKSGAQVGHMLDQRRPITEKTVKKIEGLRGYEGWFSPQRVDEKPSPDNLQPSGLFGPDTDHLSEVGAFNALSRVAVVGMARLGDNGYYEEISSMPGAGDGTVLAQSEDVNAYALRVRGDSMFPAIRDGWYVVVEPNSAPSPGEYVLIKLRNGQKMVKELILHRSDSITVVSVNGDKRRTIMSDEIDNHYGIQAVVSILPPSKWRP